jgi:uncharacterized protein
MKDVEVLVNSGCTPDIVEHCMAVSSLALSIADRLKITVNRELVRQGGLFHDIGRSRTNGIKHAIVGVEIAKGLGLPVELQNIIECHIGAGIKADEAIRLGLPQKDYMPHTVEEKIVSYADNMVNKVSEISFPQALDRFKSILGPDHEGVGFFIKQHEEMQGWMR